MQTCDNSLRFNVDCKLFEYMLFKSEYIIVGFCWQHKIVFVGGGVEWEVFLKSGVIFESLCLGVIVDKKLKKNFVAFKNLFWYLDPFKDNNIRINCVLGKKKYMIFLFKVYVWFKIDFSCIKIWKEKVHFLLVVLTFAIDMRKKILILL